MRNFINRILGKSSSATTLDSNANTSSKDIDLSIRDIRTIVDLVSIYGESAKNIAKYYNEIDEIKDTYIAEIILEQLIYDAITPDISDDDIISIVPNVKNSRLSSAIDKFNNKIDVNQLIEDIIGDLIAYGEYTIRPVVGDNGIDGIEEILPGEVISFYKNQDLLFHVKLKSREDLIPESIHKPGEFVKFFVRSRRIRLKLSDSIIRFIRNRNPSIPIPKYVRVGSPLFTPGRIKKIKQLNLLEELVPAMQIDSLRKSGIVGVKVPLSMSPQEAIKYANKIERKINDLGVGIDPNSSRITVADILKSATYKRVIPVTSDKGDVVEIRDPKRETIDLLSPINDVREVILSSVGIPPELIFNRGESERSEILKRYSRYFRRIRYIQESILTGVRELVNIHLVNMGITVSPDDFTVRFNNSPINVDDLDRLEFQQATVQLLSDIFGFIDTLAGNDTLSKNVDINGVMNYINDALVRAGFEPLLKSSNKKSGEE